MREWVIPSLSSILLLHYLYLRRMKKELNEKEVKDTPRHYRMDSSGYIPHSEVKFPSLIAVNKSAMKENGDYIITDEKKDNIIIKTDGAIKECTFLHFNDVYEVTSEPGAARFIQMLTNYQNNRKSDGKEEAKGIIFFCY